MSVVSPGWRPAQSGCQTASLLSSDKLEHFGVGHLLILCLGYFQHGVKPYRRRAHVPGWVNEEALEHIMPMTLKDVCQPEHIDWEVEIVQITQRDEAKVLSHTTLELLIIVDQTSEIATIRFWVEGYRPGQILELCYLLVRELQLVLKHGKDLRRIEGVQAPLSYSLSICSQAPLTIDWQLSKKSVQTTLQVVEAADDLASLVVWAI